MRKRLILGQNHQNCLVNCGTIYFNPYDHHLLDVSIYKNVFTKTNHAITHMWSKWKTQHWKFCRKWICLCFLVNQHAFFQGIDWPQSTKYGPLSFRTDVWTNIAHLFDNRILLDRCSAAIHHRDAKWSWMSQQRCEYQAAPVYTYSIELIILIS